MKPRNTEVLYSIGYVFKEKKDLKNARKFFKKVVRSQKPKQEEFCSRAYYHLGEISRAKNYFELCLKSNPNHRKANQYDEYFNPFPIK